jgi:methyl-accepting chemotaxis protein
VLGPWLTLGVGLVVLCIGAVLTARWIVGPIVKLEATASALARGDLTARSGLVRGDELGRLARRIDDMGEEIVEAHGGAIEVTSAVGRGTRARVSVPAATICSSG